MPRQRIINPEFWVDDTLSQLSLNARLFYIGIWNFSDDYGVIENNSSKLKAQIFPYDSIRVQPLIDELVTAHRLIPFQSENKEWFYVKNFLKWQKVEKPSKWRNPPFLGESSPTPPRPVVSQVKRSEEKRREEKLSEEREVVSTPTPAEEAKEFFNHEARQLAVVVHLMQKGIPEKVAAEEVLKFVSYWTERTKSGLKQKWETEKTFELSKRFGRWFKNYKTFNDKSQTKGTLVL